MSRQYIHVELLLGEKVFALNGQAIGRLEEIRTEVNKGHYLYRSFSLVSTLCWNGWLRGTSVARCCEC